MNCIAAVDVGGTKIAGGLLSYEGKLLYERIEPVTGSAGSEVGIIILELISNLISMLNPEKVILGGGVFESAAPLMSQIIKEAKKWAQPIAFDQASIECSALGNYAGLYGAVFLALESIKAFHSYG